MKKEKVVNPNKVSLGNKLAFASGDIFGGGSFNIINFLFTPFLTLVVGIPMIHLTWLLLLTKIWDGIIDPFIGKVTDGKQPGKYGKRRYFMLICAPLVLVGFVLLFFPWNLVTNSIALKCVLVVLMYMLYATAQSFVLIPYYSHASEMTDDFAERNKANAVRIAFSIASSTICVAVPGAIAGPGPDKGSTSYILMASVFGFIFMVSILITALFSREKIVSPAIKTKFNIKEFVRPLKVKTYRQYLGMQMCTSMAMAVMSSFFFTFCDFYIKRQSYAFVTSIDTTTAEASRFRIATIAAAMMFIAQIIALPMYLQIIKRKSKRFAYITGAIIWIAIVACMFALPGEKSITTIASEAINSEGKAITKYYVSTKLGTPNWLIIIMSLVTGLGIGGTVFVPHSSFGDVCDVGELYFGERTEGTFSGLTNFLNTTAQAIGLAIPPAIIGLAGYVETQYVTGETYKKLLVATEAEQVKELGMALSKFQPTYYEGSGSWQLLPIEQSDSAQLAIRLTFILLPIVIMAIGIVIASRYKLTKDLQTKIVEANAREDKDSDDFKQTREELLKQL